MTPEEDARLTRIERDNWKEQADRLAAQLAQAQAEAGVLREVVLVTREYAENLQQFPRENPDGAAGNIEFDWSVLERLDRLEDAEAELDRYKKALEEIALETGTPYARIAAAALNHTPPPAPAS